MMVEEDATHDSHDHILGSPGPKVSVNLLEESFNFLAGVLEVSQGEDPAPGELLLVYRIQDVADNPPIHSEQHLTNQKRALVSCDYSQPIGEQYYLL